MPTTKLPDELLEDIGNHVGGVGALIASNNLSDVVSASASRTNLGLGNVDNTADTAKPVSTAQQTALDLKAPLASPAFTGTPTGITKAHVGLGNVDNTSDVDKPVSTATTTQLNLKQNQDTLLDSISLLGFAGNSLKSLRVNAGETNFELVTPAGGGDMLGANNLSDVANAATSRTNLGLGSLATLSTITASELSSNAVETAKINNSAVTLAKIQNIATARFLGRVTAATGVVEELTNANAKTILALVKGDVGLGNVDNTSDANKPVSTAQQTEIDTKQDADAQLTDIAALSYATNGLKVVRVNAGETAFELATAGTGDMLGSNNLSDVASAATSRTNLGLGSLATLNTVAAAQIDANAVETAKINNSAVTLAKIQNIATARFLGRVTAASGVVEELTNVNAKTILALVKADVGLGNVDNTADSVKNVADAVDWDGATKTSGTGDPTGGADGDIHFKYPA